MSGALSDQRGQALAEAAVMLGVLAALLGAVHATGVWQVEAMRAALAARQAAFAHTRFAPVPVSASAPGRDAEPEVHITLAAALPDGAQPGGAHRHAAVLRREWQLGDVDVASAQAVVPMSHASRAGGALTLTRYTAVLRGAGHSAGDAQVQQRVTRSALAWQTPARQATSAGQVVAAWMNPVDRAWGRPAPGFDWLSDWTAMVPPEFLRAGGRQP